MSDGFALRRRGKCHDDEEDCGATDKPYRACCPKSSFCPRQWNVDCCSSDRNCTSDLNEEPSCADESWDLYDNSGYFCCEVGLLGYNSTRESSGCASPGYSFEGGEESLPKVKEGKVPSPSASSSPSGGGVPGGAIAGAVVGGVAGAALIAAAIWWFFIRRRKNRGAELDDTSEGQGPSLAQGTSGPPRELDPDAGEALRRPKELDAGASVKPRELDSAGNETPSERGGGWKTEGNPVQLGEQHGVSELPG